METLEKQISHAIRLQRAAVTGTLTTVLELQKAGAGVVPQSLEKISWIPKDGIKTVSSMLRIGSKTTEDMAQFVDQMYGDLENMVSPAAAESKKTSPVSKGKKTSVSRPEKKEAQSGGAATKVRQRKKTATPAKKNMPAEKKQAAASNRKSPTAGNTTKQKKTIAAARIKKEL